VLDISRTPKASYSLVLITENCDDALGKTGFCNSEVNLNHKTLLEKIVDPLDDALACMSTFAFVFNVKVNRW
jgi:hypothetical protein